MIWDMAGPRSLWSRDVRAPRNAFWLFPHRPPPAAPGSRDVSLGSGGLAGWGAEGQLCPAQLLLQKSLQPHPTDPPDPHPPPQATG